MRNISVIMVGVLFTTALPAADPWNINENFVGFAIADADWTINQVFPGTKLIIDGRYSIRRGPGKPSQRDCECEPPPIPDRMLGTIDAHLQWGEGETSLEYAILSATALGYQREFEPVAAKFRPLRDTLEWGIVRGGFDDPLGIDSYAEVNLVRGGRTWGYKLSDQSPWLFTLGLKVAVGYAWADSFDPAYQDVANPTIGSWVNGTIKRERWGELYIEQGVINGFTLSSPARGGSVSREAVFRFGYFNQFHRCLTVDLFVDKRSFNFSDPDLVDLYTKSRRTGVELGCVF